jgi:hypothetical protein
MVTRPGPLAPLTRRTTYAPLRLLPSGANTGRVGATSETVEAAIDVQQSRVYQVEMRTAPPPRDCSGSGQNLSRAPTASRFAGSLTLDGTYPRDPGQLAAIGGRETRNRAFLLKGKPTNHSVGRSPSKGPGDLVAPELLRPGVPSQLLSLADQPLLFAALRSHMFRTFCLRTRLHLVST